jgi:transposase-like protein
MVITPFPCCCKKQQGRSLTWLSFGSAQPSKVAQFSVGANNACPRCAASAYWTVKHQGRELFQCANCRHQTSLTAGTVFASTKLPLTTWFLAIYLLSQAKTGLSALALKRQLGVSYPTAWLIHHKILHAMAQQEQTHRLEGMVQIDDAYLGGERSDGTTGRGATGKTPFVAAVSLNDAGHPLYVKLSTVSAFASEAIGRWACRNLEP